MIKDISKEHFTIYRCSICGNIIVKLSDSGLTPQCCGRDMYELSPGEKEASEEYHIPICSFDGKKLTINVGEKAHPMNSAHYIEWIMVRTSHGFYVHRLHPDSNPDTCFKLCHDEQIIKVYAYCNLHGLWSGDSL